jgi:hypothetical protein
MRDVAGRRRGNGGAQRYISGVIVRVVRVRTAQLIF